MITVLREPNPRRVIITARYDAPAGRREAGAAGRAGIPSQSDPLPPARRVTHGCRVAPALYHDAPAVRRGAEDPDTADMPLERAPLGQAPCIPFERERLPPA